MKKSTSIILGILVGLNALKIVLYLVFIALLIVFAPSSGTPGWLLGVAFVLLIGAAIVMIPYVIVLIVSLVQYFIGIKKKKIGSLKISAVLSAVGSYLAAIFIVGLFGEAFANSPEIIYLHMVVGYFIAEGVLATVAYFRLKKYAKKGNGDYVSR